MQPGFGELLQLVRTEARRRVRNGQVTERGLSIKAGISQPYLHNVLKGVRRMTPDLADRLLRELDFSVADLLADHARTAALLRKPAVSEGAGVQGRRATASR